MRSNVSNTSGALLAIQWSQSNSTTTDHICHPT